MLAADGSELRHRPVAQPVSEPGKYQEESILVRRAKMAQEDREPANLWVFGLVIVLWCLLCGVAWYVVIRHDEHYIIDEIHHGHVANVREFLHEHHAPYRLNKLDEHHESLLHHAVESNQPKIVQLLLDYKVKIDHVDEQKQMPIHRAVYHGWPVLVKLLIDAGSPLTAQDKMGKDPLGMAVWLARNSPANADRAEIKKMLEEAKERKDAARAAQGLGDE